MVSYKYRSGAAALRCLSEGTAYFALPSELNDSLEAKYESAGTSEFIDAITSALNELERQRGGPGNYAFNANAFGEFERTNAAESQRFEQANQRVGIFSTAARADDQSMWAYYCNDSKGVCFELEWSEQTLQRYQICLSPVNYTRNSRIHNRADDLRQYLLELGLQYPDWTISQLQEFSMSKPSLRAWGIRTTARAISTKHADWQHEAELRFLVPRAGPIPIMQDILKRVFFIRTDFPEWGDIMSLLVQQYPHVRFAQLSFEHTEPFVRVQPMAFKKFPDAS